MTEELTFSPTLSFISDADKKKLFASALQLLEEIGQKLEHKEALKLMIDAGAIVEDNIVKIPSGLVEKALKTVPSNIPVYNREGELAMELGDRRSYYGTGSDLIYRLKPGTQERHHCRLEDVIEAARLADALPNLDFVMSFAHPHELDPNTAYLASFKAMAENTVNPIVNTAEGYDDLYEIWKISAILRGGEQELRDKPYWIHYAEPSSPLNHPDKSIDKLLLCAEKGMPVIYSPAPIAGSTAPMTIAGHVTQGLAESLFGVVIHQLKAEGSPILMGMGAAVLDMATSQCSYNAPEYLMAYLTMVEMTKFLNVPNWGYAGTTDAQIPDGQATYEAGLLAFLSSTIGSNLNHDVGYVDFGRAGSLEMMVIMNEIISQIRRMQQGVIVNDEQIALDVIKEVGLTDHFLSHAHTLKHFKSTQWRPKLLTRQAFHTWEEKGSKPLLQRANEQLAKIQKKHTPQPIEEQKAAEIEKLVAAFKG